VRTGLTAKLLRQLRRVSPQVRDVGLAAAVTIADLNVFSADLILEPTVVAYASLGAGALVFRRRAPFTVFVFVWLHALVGLFLFSGYGPVIGLLLVLYTVAAHGSTIAARVALGLAFVSTVVYAVHESYFTSQLSAEGPQGPVHRGFGALLVFVVFYGLLIGPVWAAGRWVQERRLRMEASEAVAAERVRISRELHDIVAHSVTLMMLEAAVAKRMMASDLSQAGRALADVDEQGQQAMSELRRMLAVLRADELEHSGFDMEAQRGLSDVKTLVTAVNRTGVVVDLVSPDEYPRLDPSVDLTAYRVVQEALTNVTKHAGVGAHAVVRLTRAADDELVVQVRDDGKGKPHPAMRAISTGHGLLGIRERVVVVGGQFSAGATFDDGFEVTARLPIGSVNRPGASIKESINDRASAIDSKLALRARTIPVKGEAK